MTSLTAATERLLATARSLPDDEWSAPSLCAGWTRAHVLAHVALNAEALAGVLRGLRDGRPTPMYDSADARDADIDALAASPPPAVRRRLASACRSLADVLEVADGLAPDASFERTPGGPRIPGHRVPVMRLGEVEIHHADLDAGYSWSAWPEATARVLLDDAVRRYDGPGLTLAATEGGRWALGTPADDAPTVTGPVAALAWWSTGRAADAVLSSSTGELPRMEGR